MTRCSIMYKQQGVPHPADVALAGELEFLFEKKKITNIN